ncbi:MAG: hypothetical protein ABDH37_03700 [Candidatus Hydrothermales bacterium]
MRKIVINLFFLLSPLIATETRVRTMGGVVDFIKDDLLALTYPSQILSFPSLFVLEAFDIGTLGTDNSYLKGYFGIGENHSLGVFGAYLNIPVYSYINKTIRGLMFSYGKYFGEKFSLGFNVGFSNYSMSEEDTVADYKNKEDARIFLFNPGFTFSFSESHFVDVAFNFRNRTFDRKFQQPVDTVKAKGTQDISFDVRYLRSLSEYTSFVIGFHFQASDRSIQRRVGGNTVDTTLKFSSFTLNSGFNIQPVDVLSLILGIQVLNLLDNFGDFGKEGEFSINSVLGLEADLGKWFILRLSTRKAIILTTKEEYLDQRSKTTETSQGLLPVSLGLAYKRGNLRIDAEVSPEIFYNGPYFVTGNQSDFFTIISILYSF